MAESPLPSGSRAALAALIDTFLPPIDAEGDGSTASFMSARASELGFIEAAEEVINGPLLHPSERRDTRLLLRALSTGFGTAALFATPALPGFALPFAERPVAEREKLLLWLASSSIGLHRRAFLGLKRLLLPIALTFRSSPEPFPVETGTTTTPNQNVFQAWLGYPGPQKPLGKPAGAMCDFRAHAGPRSGEHECDVVVVGSGAGGGVAAALLAQAGLRVVVVEKGRFIPPAELPCDEKEAFGAMYEKGGLLTSDDGAIGILAGATLGGGTTVNWACCLAPPARLREEWASRHGLPRLAPGSAEFDASLAAVLARIGATDEGVVHNAANRALIDGCEALGWGVRTAPQNLRRTGAEEAGWTCFGDREVNKQGGLATYLADAAAAGATFVDEARVQRLTFDEGGDGGYFGPLRATGVVATTAEGGTLTLRASRCVVVAAGALHSPCLLLRSGLRRGGVGKRLRLHPVTGVEATYDKEVAVWGGAPMTTVSEVDAAGPRGDGYGARLEVPSIHPGLMAAAIAWRSGAAFKAAMSRVRRTAATIVLQRDGGDGGRVTLGEDGFGPSVRYSIRADDEASMVRSVESAARAAVAAGALEVATLQSGVPPLAVPPPLRGVAAPGKNAPLEAWLARVRAAGLPPNGAALFSAHQMGTCRMGSDPATAVVDEEGECWEADGLYVCDASLFPTASGANPMVTCLALAHLVASRLAARLTRDADKDDEAAADEERRRATRRAAVHRGGGSLAGDTPVVLGLLMLLPLLFCLFSASFSMLDPK